MKSSTSHSSLRPFGWCVGLIFSSFLLSACETVQYGQYILNPEASISVEPRVGFGPFSEVLEDYSIKTRDDPSSLHASVHIAPNIPYQQEQKFRECYGLLPENEPIYALLDATLGLSTNSLSCYGQAFTDKGVHFNHGSLSLIQGKYFIPYSTLYDYRTRFRASSSSIIFTIGSEEVWANFNVNHPGEELKNIFEVARRRSLNPAYQSYEAPATEYSITTIPEGLKELFASSYVQGLWLEEDIPPNKLRSFKRCTGLTDEEIFIYLDGTFWGTGGCHGAGFSNSGLYFHNSWVSDFPGAHFISYDQLFLSEFTPYLTDYIYLYFSPYVAFDVSGITCDGCSILGPAGGFLEILKGIRGNVSLSDKPIQESQPKLVSSPKIDVIRTSVMPVVVPSNQPQSYGVSAQEMSSIERRACSNDVSAQVRLAELYSDISNPQHDLLDAYFWAMAAANNGGGDEAIALTERNRSELGVQQLQRGFERLKTFALFESC